MVDVLGYLLAEKDKAVATATKEAATAKEETAIAKEEAANKDRKFVTYLINDGKTNEEIKKIVSDISDDFINKMRESVVTD